MTHHNDDGYADIISHVTGFFTEDDDPLLWEVAVVEIFRDADYLCEHSRTKASIFAKLGACSNWQRPHQHRWLKDGSFAAPYGYGGTGFNIHALPEFDWVQCLKWMSDKKSWLPVERIDANRPLILRVTLPTRTAKHDQAAVHTIWQPGSPTTPTNKILRFYGFRKDDDGQWRFTATAGHEAPYEVPSSSE